MPSSHDIPPIRAFFSKSDANTQYPFILSEISATY